MWNGDRTRRGLISAGLCMVSWMETTESGLRRLHLQAVCHLDKKYNFSDIRFLYLRNVVGIKYSDCIKCLAQCTWHSKCSRMTVIVLSGRESSKERKVNSVAVGRWISQSSPEKNRANRRERARGEYKKFAHVIIEACKSQGLLYARWKPGGWVVYLKSKCW